MAESLSAAPGGPATPARVAVLGGTGFIGRPLCAALAERGHAVVAIGRREPATPVAATFVRLDVEQAPPKVTAEVFAEHRVTHVINAAGGMWGLTDEELVGANLTLVENVIAAIGRSDRAPRLVHLGTVHEYGLVPVGTILHEDSPARPVTAYGTAKLRCTERIGAAAADAGLDAIVLRVGNVVGAGQPGHSLLGGVAARLSRGAGSDGPVRLAFASLGARRDFVDLDDVVAAVVLAAESTARGVVNIGAGAAVPARDLVRLLVEAGGVPAEVIEEFPDPDPDEQWQCMSVARAEEVLSWRPVHPLGHAMRRLWARHAAERVGRDGEEAPDA
ncbi:NAD-dependent epimerase/dehydratase family protein [Embleya sp. MST-111070]|uniref:NAD-dependent epimerase/dehydratase family protein n=1 Tax=Embleya sp. MST-111070 TaxID=3398231 RepID=UPI003F7351BA